jgi:hypothetical protein
MYQRVLVVVFQLVFTMSASAHTLEQLTVMLKYSMPDRAINQELIQQGVVKSPANTLQWLVKFQALENHYCLMYRVPFAKQNLSGKLYLYQLPAEVNCPSSLPEDLSFIFANELEIKSILSKSLTVSLINEKSQKQKIFVEFYDGSHSRLIFNPNEYKAVTIADGETCLEYDGLCNIKADRCRLCRNGNSLVAGGECTKHYNRRCGIKPDSDYAHVRGKSYSSTTPVTLGCHINSIEGFCSNQKNMLCFDGVLRCQ